MMMTTTVAAASIIKKDHANYDHEKSLDEAIEANKRIANELTREMNDDNDEQEEEEEDEH